MLGRFCQLCTWGKGKLHTFRSSTSSGSHHWS